MLTRRHIRVKVMQAIYSFYKNDEENTLQQEKNLLFSLEQIQDLYLLMLHLLLAIQNQAKNYMLVAQKKHLATHTEKNPSKIFIDNKVLALIRTNTLFQEISKNKKINYWTLDTEYPSILFSELKEQDWYQDYLLKETSTFNEDKVFLIKVYKELIAPNEKLYEYLEDKRLSWLDDYPLVNTLLIRILSKINPTNMGSTLLPEVYKNHEDRDFSLELFKKVIEQNDEISKQIEGKTPNWDQERIANLDMIILKMGVVEFLYFPTIPERVTINEYLEIAKEYSTPKSSIFINGILDKLVKEFSNNNKLNKKGRGLK